MNWSKTLASTSLVLLVAANALPLQRATEIYTPIGKSPGLSGTATIIGTISSVDKMAHTITVTANSERWTVEVTDSTDIWIDRSKDRKTNEYGSFSDLSEGARVEVLYVDREERGAGPADWIKVEKSH